MYEQTRGSGARLVRHFIILLSEPITELSPYKYLRTKGNCADETIVKKITFFHSGRCIRLAAELRPLKAYSVFCAERARIKWSYFSSIIAHIV